MNAGTAATATVTDVGECAAAGVAAAVYEGSFWTLC